jgi:hypothetical protein
MKHSLYKLALFFGLLAVTHAAAYGQHIKILTNHIGYEQDAPKRAVILGHTHEKVTAFDVIDCATGKKM